MRGLRTSVVVAICIAILAFQGQPLSAAEHGKVLDGSWMILASQNTPFPAQGRMLVTFLPSGAIVGTDDFALSGLVAPDHPQAFLQSPGHGVWQRVGKRQFAFSYLKLHYNGRGQAAGSVRINGVATLNAAGDVIGGTFRFVLLDLQGQPVFGGDGELNGSRMTVEP